MTTQNRDEEDGWAYYDDEDDDTQEADTEESDQELLGDASYSDEELLDNDLDEVPEEGVSQPEQQIPASTRLVRKVIRQVAKDRLLAQRAYDQAVRMVEESPEILTLNARIISDPISLLQQSSALALKAAQVLQKRELAEFTANQGTSPQMVEREQMQMELSAQLHDIAARPPEVVQASISLSTALTAPRVRMVEVGKTEEE